MNLWRLFSNGTPYLCSRYSIFGCSRGGGGGGGGSETCPQRPSLYPIRRVTGRRGCSRTKPGWTLLVLAIGGLDPSQKHIMVTHSFPSDFYRLFVTSSKPAQVLEGRVSHFWIWGGMKKDSETDGIPQCIERTFHIIDAMGSPQCTKNVPH